jgi:hypothetical protein
MSLEAPLPRNLVVALAKRRFGQGTGAEIVRWAETALERLDSVSLAILAGLTAPQNEFEVDSYLERASKALGFQLPEPDDLARLYARIIAEDIVGGSVNPFDGCRILNRLAVATEQCALSVWIGLDDAVYLAREGIHDNLDSVESRIRAEAERMLKGCIETFSPSLTLQFKSGPARRAARLRRWKHRALRMPECPRAEIEPAPLSVPPPQLAVYC